MQRPWTILLAGFAMHLAILGGLQASIEGFADLDAWYHAKIARSVGRVELAPFHWAADSIWAEDFADKEWLYHVYLAPFARVGERWGDEGVVVAIKFATALLGALALTAVLWLLMRCNASRPLWWSALALCVGWPMLLRLVAVRPHTISVLLLLLALLCFIEKRDLLLGVVGALYALSYTACHTLPIAVGIATVALLIMRREARWQPLVAVTVGVALGLLVHPHYPANLQTWYVQNVLMWQLQVFGSDAALQAQDFSSELVPLTLPALLVKYGPLLLVWAYGIVVLLSCRVRVGDDTIVVAAVAIAFGVLNAGAERFAEYWTPLSIAAMALGTRDALESPGCWPWLRRDWKPSGRSCAIVGMTVLTLGAMRQVIGACYNVDPVDLRPAARWLAEHAEDEKIYHPHFGEFGVLWYHHDRGRYIVALDPVFAYARDRERCRTYLRTAQGKEPDPVRAIRDQLGCRWIVIAHTHADKALMRQLRAAEGRGVKRHKKWSVERRRRPLFDRFPWTRGLFGHIKNRKPIPYIVRVFELIPD